jgi:hypothetical protein
MSEVQSIISPVHPFFYSTEETEEAYWLQHCGKRVGQWSPKLHPNTPNSLFLLLRDVPLPSNYTDSEVQLTIGLSRWRNSGHSIPKPEEIARGDPTTLVLSNIVIITPRFLRTETLSSWFARDTEYLFLNIVRRIKLAVVDSTAEIQPTFLDRLRLYFESTLIGSDCNVNTTVCLLTPLDYRAALSNACSERRSIHYIFTLLLARNLKHYYGGEKVQKTKEIITMLWASPINRGLGAENLVRKFGMENFFVANKIQMMTWTQTR